MVAKIDIFFYFTKHFSKYFFLFSLLFCIFACDYLHNGIPPNSDDAALKGSSCYELSSHDYLKRHVYGSMPPAPNHYLTL